MIMFDFEFSTTKRMSSK